MEQSLSSIYGQVYHESLCGVRLGAASAKRCKRDREEGERKRIVGTSTEVEQRQKAYGPDMLVAVLLLFI